MRPVRLSCASHRMPHVRSFMKAFASARAFLCPKNFPEYKYFFDEKTEAAKERLSPQTHPPIFSFTGASSFRSRTAPRCRKRPSMRQRKPKGRTNARLAAIAGRRHVAVTLCRAVGCIAIRKHRYDAARQGVASDPGVTKRAGTTPAQRKKHKK